MNNKNLPTVGTTPISDHINTPPTDLESIENNQHIMAAPDRKIAGKTYNGLESRKEYDQVGPLPQATLDEALGFCQASQEFWQQGELENALEALDEAYSLILALDDLDSGAEIIQQKEDLRFLIARRILEIHASRHIVVNGDYKAIPITINKHVESEIKRFTVGSEKSFFINSYKRSGKYREQITAKIKEAGLPVELSWLPLIESGFKVNALSKARALGLWQFIPSTGYKFGLNRNKYVDERLDPVKATDAAIAYLKELHQIFGDWITVMAAYNCGENRVLRVIRNQNVNYLDNFWDLYGRLPRETARYVPRFLATIHILNNPDKYGLNAITLDPPLHYETKKIARHVRLEDVAKTIGVSKNELYELNPELRHKVLPNEPYSLKVPPGKGDMLIAKLKEIPISTPPRPAYAYHKVKSGETLSGIAERYRVKMHEIARVNRLNRKYTIVKGRRLKIPLKPITRYASKKYQPKRSERTLKHVVRKGDSLWNLARRYGTTTKTIQRASRLRTTALRIGQVLTIPGKAGGVSTSKKRLSNYRVKKGDNPFLIARKNNMSLKRLLHLNRLGPRSKIYPGQILSVE